MVRKVKSLVLVVVVAVLWCVSSEDQSSCLRQTGCNQACHIDHHQALLHHRRSIHHCIGGAAHSLVTAPPLLGFCSKTSTNRPGWPLVIDQLQVGWSMVMYVIEDDETERDQRVRFAPAVGSVTVPPNDKQGVTFQLSRPPSPQRPARHQIYFAVHLI